MSWLSGWNFRKSHTIDPATGAGQDYQVRVRVLFGAGADSGADVYLDSKCRTDFGDLRFTNSTGITLLAYWIEEKADSDYAICWVKISDDIGVYSSKLYLYYGNAGSTSIADGDATFIFFDDFEAGLSKWTAIGKKVGPYTAFANQHKMVQTSDGTIHAISTECFSAGSATSAIDLLSSRDLGATWETLNVRLWTPGQLNLPAIAKDSNDNLYVTYGYMAGGADGKIRIKKATANKAGPTWVWSLGAEVSVDATITDGGVPDIIVDSNNYVHVVYCRQLLNKSRWARSIDGGATWTREEITIPGGGYQGYMIASIDKDSQNNLYFGLGPLFVGTRDFKFWVEKVDYLGGTAWLQNTPVEASSAVSTIGQLNVLPDDRICLIYGLKDDPNVYFRKTTSPRDLSSWSSEINIGESVGTDSRNSSLSFTDSSNLMVVFLSPSLHDTLDLALTESSDGGATWSTPVLITDSPIPHRYPASLRTTVAGDMLFVYGDYADWEAKYGNFWFRSSGESDPVLVYGSSPTISVEHAYAGAKSVELAPLVTTSIQRVGGPNTNHAVHVHFYDQMSPLAEYSVFSFDAGESEESFLGIITDIDHYEYLLQGVTYDSGIDRTVGWHEFVARMSPGLKEFLIDENLMPVTGIENYGGIISLVSSALSQINSFWDAVFETKYISPEPSHAAWGVEETAGAGITTFEAEDITKTNLQERLCDDLIYMLEQKAAAAEELSLSPLKSSLHVPAYTSEDLLVALARIKTLFAEDEMLALLGSLHVPRSSEDMLLALATQRLYQVVNEFGGIGGIFPIIGGVHVIGVVGDL